MIVDINKIGFKLNGTSNYANEKICGEPVWETVRACCSNCGKETEGPSYYNKDKDVCECGAVLLTSISSQLYIEKDSKEYELYSKSTASKEFIENNPLIKEKVIHNWDYIETSPYRFDIMKRTIKVKYKHEFTPNDDYIPKENRNSNITYPVALKALYISKLNQISIETEVDTCLSYDINKKPGERMTLIHHGKELEVNKKTLQDVFGTLKCVELSRVNLANRSVHIATDWVNNNIVMASQAKALKNALIKFEEPTLREELAIKHGLSEGDIIISNPDATKLHEVLGISKAYLKFMTIPDDKSFNKFEKMIRLHYKTFGFTVYHKLGDRYKEFYKDMDKFHDFNLSNNKQKFLDLYSIGYDMNRLYEYLSEECIWQQGLNTNTALSQLYDYVNMCVELDITDFERYPKALRTRHDVIAMRYNSVKSAMKDSRSFDAIVDKYKKLEYGTSKYKLLIAKTPKELVHEGHALSHCVGSYADRMISEANIIFFMRDTKDLSKPLCTIEVMKEGSKISGHRLVLGQCKGYLNRELNATEKQFISRFKKYVLDRAIINEDGSITIQKPTESSVLMKDSVTVEERVAILQENALAV